MLFTAITCPNRCHDHVCYRRNYPCRRVKTAYSCCPFVRMSPTIRKVFALHSVISPLIFAYASANPRPPGPSVRSPPSRSKWCSHALLFEHRIFAFAIEFVLITSWVLRFRCPFLWFLPMFTRWFLSKSLRPAIILPIFAVFWLHGGFHPPW